MVLRVRLDECVVEHGVTSFCGVPLTGVGAEVGPEGVAEGRNYGRVKLFAFEAGRCLGPWHEPLFRGDQAILIAEPAAEYVGTHADRAIFDGQPLTGAIVEFSGPSISSFTRVVDGYDDPRTPLYFYRSGFLGRAGLSAVVDVRHGTVGFTQLYSWRDGEASVPHDSVAVRSELSFAFGQMSVPGEHLPEMDGGFEVTEARFERFQPGDHRAQSSSHSFGRDADGRLNHVGLSGPSHFTVLPLLGLDVELLDWLPLSLDEVAGMEVAPEFSVDLGDDEVDVVLNALGGISALRGVERLSLLSYRLDPDRVAEFFALPNLAEVDVTESDSGNNELRGIRRMCTDLAARGVNVIYDQAPLLP